MHRNGKVKSLESLAQELETLRSQNKKIVHCHGIFDLLHVGHLRYFKEAKAMGDVLVVTLTPDCFVNKGPMRPVFSESYRAEMIASLDIVDHVAVNQWPTAIETIQQLKPHIYVKGPDYRNHENDVTGKIRLEEESVRSINGEIRYTSDVTFSSSALLNEHFPLYTEEQINYLKTLKEKYRFPEIRDSIEKLSKLKVLLVGEIIIDEYIYCDAIGKSGKEPVLVTKKLRQEVHAGGILAIANHLSDFCGDITVVSYLGDQSDQADFIQKSMRKNVKLDTVVKKGSPTIIKRRYVDSYTKAKLLGVYEINDEMISLEEEEKISSKLKKHMESHDVVIVADYGHGLISENIVNLLCRKSKYLAVNTQMNASNIGYHTISKYPRADYVCIHSGELRHEYRTRTKDEKELIHGLYDRMKCETLVVTKGVHGSLSYRKEEGFVSCPAFATRIIDRVGAGDTLLAVTSACFGTGLSTDISLLLGNLAAAEKIGTMGTGAAVSKTKVLKTMEAMLK